MNNRPIDWPQRLADLRAVRLLRQHRGKAWLAFIALTLVCFSLSAVEYRSEPIPPSSQNKTDGPNKNLGADFALGRREPISAQHVTVLNGNTIHARGRTVRWVGFDAPETGSKATASEKEIGSRATDWICAGSPAPARPAQRERQYAMTGTTAVN